MRHRIYFLEDSHETEYDFESGEYVDVIGLEHIRPCSLMDLGVDRSMQIFGDYKKERKVAIIQQPYKHKVEQARIGDVLYRIVAVRQNRTAFYLEVESHG